MRTHLQTAVGIVVCLVLGLCLYFFWPGLAVHDRVLRAPVRVSGIPQGMTLAGDPINDIEVRLRGPRKAIESLANNFPGYALNLSAAHAGTQTIALTADSLALPKPVSVLKITPPVLVVTLEKAVRKKLPVRLLFSGKPARGFGVTGSAVTPDVVTVRGARHLLAGLDRISTKPIDLTGISESLKKEIVLDLPEHVSTVMADALVMAQITVSPLTTTKTIRGIPVAGKNSSGPCSITPPEIDITVKGPVNILEKLDIGNELAVFVDLEDLPPGIYVRRATIILPVQTTLVDARPEIFSVTLSEP